MNTANKVVDIDILAELLDELCIFWSDPFSFKANDDLDIILVLITKPHCFLEVGLVTIVQDLDDLRWSISLRELPDNQLVARLTYMERTSSG